MFRKLSLLAAFLALSAIILGAYVRLTDAGLGCPDWPGCYGKVFVSNSGDFQSEAAKRFPGVAVDTVKAWKEMAHRYLAGTLTLLIAGMLVCAFRAGERRATALGWSGVLLALIIVQALLGMWTVSLKTMPVVVTAHLLLGLVTFWTLSWTWLVVTPGAARRPTAIGPAGPAVLGMLVLFLQIALGGWVSSNYAGLACGDFPRCQGQWLPPQADFQQAFALLHGLLGGDAGTLPAAAQLAVHWLHRVSALPVFAILSLVMLKATDADNPLPMRRAGTVLSLLLLIQIALGIFSVKYQLPLGLAIAHNAVAALLMLPLLVIRFHSRYALADTGAAAAPSVSLPEAAEAEPEPEPLAPAPAARSAEAPESLFLRLKNQLQKTRGSLGGVLSGLLSGHKPAEQLLEEVEASLIMADLGIDTTTQIVKHLRETLDHDQLADSETLAQTLKQNLYELLAPCSQPLSIPAQATPFVILVVGVNGVGKTTTIGKLAHRLLAQGHSVMLAAGDTFRAAAVEQLQTWGERNGVQVVAQHTGADSASVIYDALQSASAKGIDVLIADTAGRLHTKSNLMTELTKIKRIMAKLDPAAPHEVLLVLDAGTGQNALAQARQFHEAVNLTGLALTKLDGTAKGGVIFALANQLQLPIRFIGVGEGMADLQDFDARSFVAALFAAD